MKGKLKVFLTAFLCLFLVMLIPRDASADNSFGDNIT